jgi:hypothetical protein
MRILRTNYRNESITKTISIKKCVKDAIADSLAENKMYSGQPLT